MSLSPENDEEASAMCSAGDCSLWTGGKNDQNRSLTLLETIVNLNYSGKQSIQVRWKLWRSQLDLDDVRQPTQEGIEQSQASRVSKLDGVCSGHNNFQKSFCLH
jgi:hypothetical protein